MCGACGDKPVVAPICMCLGVAVNTSPIGCWDCLLNRLWCACWLNLLHIWLGHVASTRATLLVSWLQSQGTHTPPPFHIQIVTLLDKKERRKVDLVPDYCGFDCPNEFVVSSSTHNTHTTQYPCSLCQSQRCHTNGCDQQYIAFNIFCAVFACCLVPTLHIGPYTSALLLQPLWLYAGGLRPGF